MPKADYESGGQRFESFRARHFLLKKLQENNDLDGRAGPVNGRRSGAFGVSGAGRAQETAGIGRYSRENAGGLRVLAVRGFYGLGPGLRPGARLGRRPGRTLGRSLGRTFGRRFDTRIGKTKGGSCRPFFMPARSVAAAAPAGAAVVAAGAAAVAGASPARGRAAVAVMATRARARRRGVVVDRVERAQGVQRVHQVIVAAAGGRGGRAGERAPGGGRARGRCCRRWWRRWRLGLGLAAE